MKRFLLDTNIISNAVKTKPDASLETWMANQEDHSLFIAAFTVAEIWRGILEKPPGKKRNELEAWFHGGAGPHKLFPGRILPFDEAAAIHWAQLMASGKKTGRSRSALDTIIAAIALAHDCIVVTGNLRHFEGIQCLNPFRGGSSSPQESHLE